MEESITQCSQTISFLFSARKKKEDRPADYFVSIKAVAARQPKPKPIAHACNWFWFRFVNWFFEIYARA